MKRVLLFIFSLCVFATMQAQEIKVGSYYCNYFTKEYDVEATRTVGDELSIYFYIPGESRNDKVCVNVKGENINSFISALTSAKHKYTEWVNVAISNNVNKMTKRMDVVFPKLTICWIGSEWWFDYSQRFSPIFMITDEGKYLCVISGTATASSNEYIDQDYYLVFESVDDFDALINAMNPTIIEEKLNNRKNLEDLFQ